MDECKPLGYGRPPSTGYSRYPSTGQDRYSSPSRVRYNESVADAPGRAVQVDSIKTRVESAYGFSA